MISSDYLWKFINALVYTRSSLNGWIPFLIQFSLVRRIYCHALALAYRSILFLHFLLEIFSFSATFLQIHLSTTIFVINNITLKYFFFTGGNPMKIYVHKYISYSETINLFKLQIMSLWTARRLKAKAAFWQPHRVCLQY